MIPYIMGTIISVGTTVVIFTLKVPDVVQVMTGGQFSTKSSRPSFITRASPRRTPVTAPDRHRVVDRRHTGS